MTRKEVTKRLKGLKNRCERLIVSSNRDPDEWRKDAETVEIAISALRPVSREQVEKVWMGEWIGMTDDDGCTWYECSRCEHDLDSLEVPNHFCPACGAPMTDEAVQMVMERIHSMLEV